MAKTTGFSERDRRLFIGFLFFIELVLSYLLIDPKLSESKRKESELQAARNDLAGLNGLVASKNATASAKVPPFLALPPEKGAIVFQDRITEFVKGTGNELVAVETAIETEERGACSLTLNGSYASLSAFLDQLENPPFLMGLKKLNLGSDSGQEGPNTLRGQFELSFKLMRPSTASVNP